MAQIIQEFRKTLKLIEVEELADLYIVRPLAFLLVKAVAGTNVTPNQLTMLSMTVGVLSGVFYGLGRPSAVVFGAVFLGLSLVFDCADGQLARLKRNGTPLGRILDGVVDYVVSIAVYVGLAVGLDPGPGRRTVWLLLLAAAGLSNIVHSAALDYYRFRFIERAKGEKHDVEAEYREFRAELDKLKATPGGTLRRGIIRIYLNYLSLQMKLAPVRAASRPLSSADRDAFYRANKAAMRGWTFLGSGTFGILMIVFTLIGRFDLYLWARIVAGNLLAVVLFAAQSRIDRRLERSSPS
jgi:phosphatidylglycerophosphate synthase